jgi:hypothetical protein
LGITPEFVKGFEAVGYKNIEDDKIMSLKSLGINQISSKALKTLDLKIFRWMTLQV